MIKQKICYLCGIIIGPGHIEEEPHEIGNKTLCGWCYDNLHRVGSRTIQEFPYYRKVLLATGRVTIIPR